MSNPSPTVLAIHRAICEDSIEECLDCYGLCVKAADAVEREAVIATAQADPEGRRLADAAVALANTNPTYSRLDRMDGIK